MNIEWNESIVQEMYINERVQENHRLDYKAAKALDKTDKKKREITKDISAMANSDGGIIMYGVAEYQDKENEHLPEKIDPVDQSEFTREWLEQVINNIRPRIKDIKIIPVSIENSPTKVVYIVEIPKGDTAYQALDKRYYRRFNFLSVPMEDYEVKDVINRKSKPDISLAFKPERYSHDKFQLKFTIENIGPFVIEHFKLVLRFPNLDTYFPNKKIITLSIEDSNMVNFDTESERENQYILATVSSRNILFPEEKINLDKFAHISYLTSTELWINRSKIAPVKWKIYADDMPPKKGEIPFHELLRGF